MTDPTIPSNLRDIISRELERGERVVWTGMPKPRYFGGPAAAVFLFAIPWTAFSMYWIASAADFQIPHFNNVGDFFPLFGIPFVMVGIALLSSPVWAYRNSLKTVYLITNRRAITIDGGRSYTIRSYTPQKLTDLFRREHQDGTGDVIITREAWKDSEGDKHMQELGFLRIRNAKSVESMLKELAEQGPETERRTTRRETDRG